MSDDATWSHPAAQRRSSNIEGDGVFTTEPLGDGTIVARLRSLVVDDATLRDLIANAAAAGGYVDTIMIDDDQNLVLAPDQLITFAITAVTRRCGISTAQRSPPDGRSPPARS